MDGATTAGEGEGVAMALQRSIHINNRSCILLQQGHFVDAANGFKTALSTYKDVLLLLKEEEEESTTLLPAGSASTSSEDTAVTTPMMMIPSSRDCMDTYLLSSQPPQRCCGSSIKCFRNEECYYSSGGSPTNATAAATGGGIYTQPIPIQFSTVHQDGGQLALGHPLVDIPISASIIFNLSLAHHMIADADQQHDNNDAKRRKMEYYERALQLYKWGYKLIQQDDEIASSNPLFLLSIMNNMAMIHFNVGQYQLAYSIFQNILSSIMFYTSYCGEGHIIANFNNGMFMMNVQYKYLFHQQQQMQRQRQQQRRHRNTSNSEPNNNTTTDDINFDPAAPAA